MKKRPLDRMKEPVFALLMNKAERCIAELDDEARAGGVILNDSQVRSAVIRAMKRIQGQSPALPAGSAKEQQLAELTNRLTELPKTSGIEMALRDEDEDEPWFDGEVEDNGDEYAAELEQVARTVWAQAFETVADSIKRRKGSLPGSRSYLEFVHRFLPD